MAMDPCRPNQERERVGWHARIQMVNDAFTPASSEPAPRAGLARCHMPGAGGSIKPFVRRLSHLLIVKLSETGVELWPVGLVAVMVSSYRPGFSSLVCESRPVKTTLFLPLWPAKESVPVGAVLQLLRFMFS